MLPVRTRVLPSLFRSLSAVLAIALIGGGRSAPAQTPKPTVLASAATASPLPSEVRWSVAVAGVVAPPVIEGTRIFVVLESGHVAAYRGADGGELWRIELRSDQPITADGDRIFVTSGEALYAINAEAGAALWHVPTGKLTAPVLAHGGWVIVTSENTLTAFRSSDGGTVWSRPSAAQTYRPTIEGDNLYVPLDSGSLLALDLRAGTERWAKHFAGAPTEVLAFADRIYFASNDKYFYCLESGTGALSWRTRIGTTLRGRAIANAARVFVAGMDNVIRAFDRRSGAERWHASVPYRPTGLILVGTSIVVPGISPELRAFDAVTGKPAGQVVLPEQLATPPAFDQSGKEILMAAVIGGLSGQWKLLLTQPGPPSPPVLAVEPLTTLPGATVLVEAPPLPQ
ncbi:MAG: PQQ-binding-like beta-propeller repeat protein [Acidobacteriota bacterium]